MKIIYRFYTNFNQAQVDEMKLYGIDLETGHDRFDIEKGEQYEQLKLLIKKWGLDTNRAVGTLYDKKELDAADLLIYEGSWTNGYPQPEGEWISAQDITYDLSGYCRECGAGLVQHAPFRLKKPPVWKNKHTFELEWIYDELFVKRETYASLFEPLGIGCREVLLHKNGSIIEDTVQLSLPIANAALDLSRQPFEDCPSCGVRKYLNQIEGLFPGFSGEAGMKYPIQKSREYYGTGHASNKWLIITQELRQQMIRQGIRGQYSPMRQ